MELANLLGTEFSCDCGKTHRLPVRRFVYDPGAVGQLPRLLRECTEGATPGRPFVVAERHPDWGAEMAAQAGASALVVELIRRHQETPDPRPVNQADRLLQQLQVADDLS